MPDHGSQGCVEDKGYRPGTRLRSKQRETHELRNHTHSPSNLYLVVHAAPVGVVVGLILLVRFQPLSMDTLSLHIIIVVVRFLRLRFIKLCGRHFGETSTRVPHLDDYVKDLTIDVPWRAPQNIQSGINKLNIACLGCMSEICLLLLRVLETHGTRCDNIVLIRLRNGIESGDLLLLFK